MITRISAADAKAETDAERCLLVCIYDDDKFTRQAYLEGAIPMSKFLKKKPDLSKKINIIFYWGWPDDRSAVGLAAQYLEEGYTGASVLDKGISGWKAAGFKIL